MQLANVYGGRMDERKKWGYHLPESWQLFFDTGREIGQITADFKLEDVVKNDYVDAANNFDEAKIKADADGFKLSDAYAAVNVDEIAKRTLTQEGAAPLCRSPILSKTEAAMYEFDHVGITTTIETAQRGLGGAEPRLGHQSASAS